MHLTSLANGVSFDWNGNSKLMFISWTDPSYHNAWLALDRNNDGAITNSQEFPRTSVSSTGASGHSLIRWSMAPSTTRRQVTQVILYTGGSDGFVSSTAASIATG
jgi:hypothetical protein